ncbi:MAG: nuclear transport factor 2 family protein [Clostridiales bacterium]|nr:nuclear transport factor 2 family protein [Clostridiales bacterium]
MKDQLTWVADIYEIKTLMSRYITNVHKMDYISSFHDLMANTHPDLSFEYMESGAYLGPDHVRTYMQALHDYMQSPQDKLGYMGLHHCITPNIVINDNDDRAYGHWAIMSPWAMPATPYPCDQRKLTAMWFVGKYENEFIKLDDEWKILKIHLISYARAPYDLGWVRQADAMRIPPMYGITPDKPPRYYTYHPDCMYSSANIYNWGPYLPEDTNF